MKIGFSNPSNSTAFWKGVRYGTVFVAGKYLGEFLSNHRKTPSSRQTATNSNALKDKITAPKPDCLQQITEPSFRRQHPNN